MTKIIKRYSNRKLYDTEQSTYITLDEIAEMVKDGEDIRVIDNSSKEDLTHVTLAQIIFEQEKAHKRLLPLASLRYIIQQSGEDIMQRIQAPVNKFQDEVKRKADALEEGGKAIREFIESTQNSLDEMQARIDDRMRDTVDQLTHVPEMRREIHNLNGRVAELESTVARLRTELGSSRPARLANVTDPHRDTPQRVGLNE